MELLAVRWRLQQHRGTGFGQCRVQHDLGLQAGYAVDVQAMFALKILYLDRQFLIVDIAAVRVRGGTETYMALCDVPVEAGCQVVILEDRGERTLFVTPL